MKRIAILMMMFASSHAVADCQDEWLSFHSSSLYLSVGYSLGCYQGERIINFSKIPKNGPKWPLPLKSMPFDQECLPKKKDKAGEILEFICRKDGESPLAGATYRFKQVRTTMRCDGIDMPDWDLSFICTKGCGPTTPKRLWVVHGEGCS